MTWFTPLTKKQIKKYDAACELITNTFGSYNRVASALESHTGLYITGQTVRIWMQERKLPVPYAITLADMVSEIDVFNLLPWLAPYAFRWHLDFERNNQDFEKLKPDETEND